MKESAPRKLHQETREVHLVLSLSQTLTAVTITTTQLTHFKVHLVTGSGILI